MADLKYKSTQILYCVINFCYPYRVDKVFLWSQILEVEILRNFRILRSLESDNNIFSGSLVSLSLSLWCVCVCYQFNSNTNISIFVFEIVSKLCPNLGFLTCIIWRCYLKLLNENSTNCLCAGLQKRILFDYSQ